MFLTEMWLQSNNERVNKSELTATIVGELLIVFVAVIGTVYSIETLIKQHGKNKRSN